MISQETAAQIWKCYSEIEKGQKLLSEMEEAIKRGVDPNPHDRFGRQRCLSLGIPHGESGQMLMDVRPNLALSIIRAHIAEKEKELVEANEQARIELG